MTLLNGLVAAALLVLVAGPAAVPAAAQSTLQLGDKTPYLLRADAPNRPPGTAAIGDPSLVPDYDTVVDGININGVGVLTTPDPTDARFAFYCTATRIGPRTILTAAHCVTDEDTGALLSTTNSSAVTFLGPGSTLTSPNRVTYTASSVVVRPEWRGFETEAAAVDSHLGYDVAVLNFSTVLPNWITTYGLYTDDPLFENTTHVGYGTYGNGDQGGVGFDARRRWGQNVVDYYTSDFA